MEPRRCRRTGRGYWMTFATILGLRNASKQHSSGELWHDPTVQRGPTDKTCTYSRAGSCDHQSWRARTGSSTVWLPGQMSESSVLWDTVRVDTKRHIRGDELYADGTSRVALALF